MRQLRTICELFTNGDIDIAEYRKQLFFLAELFDRNDSSAVVNAAVGIVDATRHFAQQESDIEKVRENAKAIISVASVHLD